MTALKVIGIILLIFILIGFLRVGALMQFGDELHVQLSVGPFRFTLLPAKEKKETPKKKRLRIDPLEILIVFGGTDPADIAQTYGYASAAMWGVMPHLEDLFHIPDPSLHLRMDYSSEKTHAEGAVGLSLRIRDGLHISLALLIPMLKWYLRYKKAHKNDAPAEKPTESTPQNSEHSEKLTA